MTDFRLPPLNLAERIYRVCLYTYPASFRRAFARDLIETFRDERRAAACGHMPAAAFWMETLHDVVVNGLAERAGAATRAARSLKRIEDSVMMSFPLAFSGSELRIAARRLSRSPGFVLATVLVLGLGIGATTAMFSLVNGVLLRPLAYPDAGRLVAITHTAQVDGVTSVDQSSGGLLAYQERARAFVGTAGWRDRDVNVARPPEDPGPAERISGAMVTANLFDVLGVRPMAGRTLRSGEDRPGAAPVVVLSERLWRRYFRADRAAIGTYLEIDGVKREIVGIMPHDFRFIRSAPELWYPLTLDPATANLADFDYRSIGRLRPDQSIESAREDLARIVPDMPDEFPTGVPRAMWDKAHVQPVVTPLRDYVVGNVSRLLWIVFGSAGLVLLIACANVASLLLVRAEGRRLELAVRGALGSGLRGMMATVLSESLILGGAGGALGIGFAEIGVRFMSAYAPVLALPRADQLQIDPRVLSFALVVSAACAILVGLIPMLRAGRVPLGIVLREAGRGGTAGAARQRTRHALVIAQIALAMVLLAASALLARSFMQLQNIAPGFRAGGVMIARVVLPPATYPDNHSVALMQRRILDAVRALPGVHAASLTDWVPLTDDHNTFIVTVEDHPVPPGVVPGVHSVVTIDGGYFTAMGIPVITGRTLDPIDAEHPTREAVVSRTFAQHFWPGASPLGKRIHSGIRGPWFTIVGEVADVHYDALDQPANDVVYMPAARSDSDVTMTTPRHVALVIDASRDGAQVLPAVRAAIRSLDSALPTYDEHSMTDIVTRATARARVTVTLLLVASALALMLGSLGIYGVMSYAVRMRQREIGVRIALGADPGAVRRMISRQGLQLGGFGVALGLAFALIVTRLLRGLLFEISPTDPATLSLACGVLVAIAFVASWAPARRAASVDPAEALRHA